MKATKVFQYRPFCVGSLKEAPPTELVLGNQGEAEETNVYLSTFCIWEFNKKSPCFNSE